MNSLEDEPHTSKESMPPKRTGVAAAFSFATGVCAACYGLVGAALFNPRYAGVGEPKLPASFHPWALVIGVALITFAYRIKGKSSK